MTEGVEGTTVFFGRRGLATLAAAGAVLCAAGLAGGLTAAWGYALFAAAAMLLTAGTLAFAVVAFSRAGDTRTFQRGSSVLLSAGAWAYVLAVCALAGFYVHETLRGRMELHWIVFGPLVLAALIVLDIGLYRKLVSNNLPTWKRFGKYITRERSDPAAMRRTFVDDVLLHRTLYHTSRIRWLRHTLIYWGFMGMFLAELVAVFLREGFPAFGWRDVWREPGNPVRLAFDFAFDLTGLMILIGCVIALAWRAVVNDTSQRKFADTPTTVFLLFVVASGFLVEGWRMAPFVGEPGQGASFVGAVFAWPLARAGLGQAWWYQPLWLVHVVAACAFIAYVPVRRLIHTCATPLGRLMNSQKELLAAKKRGVLGALLPGGRPTAVRPEVPD